jgi:hypothetical protein
MRRLLAVPLCWFALYTPHASASDPAPAMREAAVRFLASLSPEQQKAAHLSLDAPNRSDWHWVPKPTRKGIPLRDMTPTQREAALALLKTGLSESGYHRARTIFDLENILFVTEKNSPTRDPGKYYFTIFGDPSPSGQWSWSAEGHHLSLNYTLDVDRIVADTPSFFGTNPKVVSRDLGVGPAVGTQNIRGEDELARKLLDSLTLDQKAKAHVDRNPLRYLNSGPPTILPNPQSPSGVAARDLSDSQKAVLESLLHAYLESLPAAVGEKRKAEWEKAGFGEIHFAWFGSLSPDLPYFYRIQGPTLLIEFDNTQNDNYGRPAGHIHCVWRRPGGDFKTVAKIDR